MMSFLVRGKEKMKKIVTLLIISLFLLTCFTSIPCINARDSSNKSVLINNSNNDLLSQSNKGQPPLPPVMWTEDFSTFYISIPQDPDGDQVYYLINWGDGTSSEWIGPFDPGLEVSISHEWSEEGTYEIKIKAKNQDGESRYTVYNLTLSSELKLFALSMGYEDITYTFTFYWTDDDYYIMIDWGDGGPNEWIGPYNQPILLSHEWDLPGEYIIKIRMKDVYGHITDWIEFMITILSLENSAPSKPYIDGKWINPRVEIECNFRAIDPDGDDIKYHINWGDGSYFVTDFNKSNLTVTVRHIYCAKGCYTIRAFAEDTYGAKGPENTLSVRHKNKAINLWFFYLFNRFPIMEKILYLLRF